MASYVVGDIQGCYRELTRLLEEVGFRVGEDTLYLAGDLVNRGPDNVSTLRFVMNTPGVHTVLGNHDLHCLCVSLGLARQSRSDTLDDVLAAPERAAFNEWLRIQPLALELPEFNSVIVHAGLPPLWSTREALAHAREVEQVLAGPDHLQFLSVMYGNEPSQWHETLEGHDRLRIITNYLTRLRFCNESGELELTHKTDIAPEGYRPWFEYPRPDSVRILFGHWAAIRGHAPGQQFVALDTGCVWGGELTALRLEDNRLFSVSREVD